MSRERLSSRKAVEVIARSGGYFTFDLLADLINRKALYQYLTREKQLRIALKRFRSLGYIYRLPYTLVDPYWNIHRSETYYTMMRSFCLLAYYQATGGYVLNQRDRSTFRFKNDFVTTTNWERVKHRGLYLSCTIREGEWLPVVVIHDNFLPRNQLSTLLLRYLFEEAEIHILGIPGTRYRELVEETIDHARVLGEAEHRKKGKPGDPVLITPKATVRIFQFEALRPYYCLPEANHEREISDFFDHLG